MSEYKWVAIYTKANQEQIACDNISRQLYDLYCPMVSRERRHARKSEIVNRPLFPGYVFVKLNISRQKWRPLLSTRGVQSLVRFGERLGYVPQEFIHELKQHETDGVLDQLMKPQISPGDNVEILDGPFRSVIAKVLSMPERDRVWLLLDMMGQQVRISHKLSGVMRA